MASEPMPSPEPFTASATTPQTAVVSPLPRPPGVAADGKVIPFPQPTTTSSQSQTSRFEKLCTITEVVCDALFVFNPTAIMLHSAGRWEGAEAMGLAVGFAALTVTLLRNDSAYSRGSSLLRVRETERVLRAWAQTLILLLPSTFLLGHAIGTWPLGLMVVLVPLLLISEKNFLYWMVSRLHARGFGVRKVAIYGAGMTGRRIFSALKRSPKLGLDPVAFIDDDLSQANSTVYEAAYKRKRCAPVLCGPVTAEKLRVLGARVVVVGIPGIAQEKLSATARVASDAGCLFCVAPFDFASGLTNVERTNLDGTLLVMFQGQQSGSDQIKTTMDFALAALLLILLSPIFVLIALAIRLDTANPVLFTQERLGKNGVRFSMYKFRTMHVGTNAYEYSPADVTDPRITRVGRFLRRSSLDELPQLLNVVRGEMSLVGPRPEMPFIVEQYEPVHRQRLVVKPGITGLWQLSADRAYRIHENLEYDLYYIRHRNFFMDVAVLLHTLVFAARGV
jgi:exopolysaccharide biosynthesis polyprenyl glycosylphosphotransferase